MRIIASFHRPGLNGRSVARALRVLWGWLSASGYRPERHYMRGGRPLGAGSVWSGSQPRLHCDPPWSERGAATAGPA
jgi:hypothetical protein